MGGRGGQFEDAFAGGLNLLFERFDAFGVEGLSVIEEYKEGGFDREYIPRFGENGADDAGCGGLDLHRCFVCFEVGQHLSFANLLTDLYMEGHNDGLFHGSSESGQYNFYRHRQIPAYRLLLLTNSGVVYTIAGKSLQVYFARSAACELDECGGDFFEGDNRFRGVEPDGFPGHSKDDAGGFILCDGMCAGLFEGQESFGAVVAHASENGSDGIGAGVFGDGVEEDFDAGFLVANGGAVFDCDVITGSGALEDHVIAAGCDEDPSGDDVVAVGGFFDLYGTGLVEPFGKGAGELCRHVLDDEGSR